MALTEFDYLHGSLSLLLILIFVIIGSKILVKYISFKQKEFITVGLALIFLSSAWWGSGFSFISYLITGNAFDAPLYFFFGDFFLPFAIVCWIYSFCQLVYPHLTNGLVLIYVVISTIFEVFLVYFLITNHDIVGIIEETFNSEHRLFSISFLIFALASVLVTVLIMSSKSMKTDDPKIKWKGRFMLLAIVSFTLGAVFDAGIPMNAFTLVLVRVFILSSAFEYYLGFFLPDKIANFLIKS